VNTVVEVSGVEGNLRLLFLYTSTKFLGNSPRDSAILSIPKTSKRARQNQTSHSKTIT
jgi:hypothetical protein